MLLAPQVRAEAPMAWGHREAGQTQVGSEVGEAPVADQIQGDREAQGADQNPAGPVAHPREDRTHNSDRTSIDRHFERRNEGKKPACAHRTRKRA